IYCEPFWMDTINYWGRRTYVAQHLEESLESDSVYCFKAYLALANRYGYAFLTTNSFGVKFTVDSLVDYTFPSGMNEINAIPDLELGENEYIIDTLNWTQFKAYYKAKGGEQFITMGNFYNNLNTPLKIIKPELNTGQYNEVITFYLDDVGLYKNECPVEMDTSQKPKPQIVNTLQVPTGFTPNNDGKNDVFRVLGSPQVSNLKLCVYNRWGKQVYCGNSIYDGWDGTHNGQPCPIDTYLWVATYTLQATGEQRVESGNVTLMR
ncbi:MAG: gliding motility-associated C-terminal domain-containing protein, partial [Bacteroidota bacterium]